MKAAAFNQAFNQLWDSMGRGPKRDQIAQRSVRCATNGGASCNVPTTLGAGFVCERRLATWTLIRRRCKL